MWRIGLVGVALTLAAVNPVVSAETQVADDVAKVQAAFSDAITEAKAVGGDSARIKQALEERQAALTAIAKGAVERQSPEHLELARLLMMLRRPEEAIGQARAALAEEPTNFAARSVLASSLAATDQLDAAVAMLDELFAQKIAEPEQGAFLKEFGSAATTVLGGLSHDGQLDRADDYLVRWDARLAAVSSTDEEVVKALEQARRSRKSAVAMVAGYRRRAELIGKSYSPLIDPLWINGPPLKPEEFRGRVVLLDFWAVWCGPCIASFPHLREWQEKYESKGLLMVGVTKRYGFDWDPAKKIPVPNQAPPEREDAAVAQFVEHHQLKYRQAVMPDNTAAQAYGVTGIPEVVLIDQNGIIRFIHVGSGGESAHGVEVMICKLLGLDPPAAD